MTRFGRHVCQDLADLSGQEVHGLDVGRLAARYSKTASERRAREEANANEVRLNVPLMQHVQQKLAEQLAAEADKVNGSLPIASVFEAYQIVKARKDLDRDPGLRALFGHVEAMWKKDRTGSISANGYLRLHDHYARRYPRSAAVEVIEEIGRKGYATLPLSDLTRIASTIETQADFDRAMVYNGLNGPQPHQVKARRFILALLNGEDVE
jgi:hypothetical protein